MWCVDVFLVACVLLLRVVGVVGRRGGCGSVLCVSPSDVRRQGAPLASGGSDCAWSLRPNAVAMGAMSSMVQSYISVAMPHVWQCGNSDG